MAFMPEYAPLVVIAFLGACALVALGAAAFAYGVVARKRTLVRASVAGATSLVGLYAALLFGASLTSREIALSPGEWKYFCEVDCHLAYAIESVTTAKSLGPTTQPVAARGRFYVVTVKTWFDERTISSWRSRDSPLWPDPREIAVLDEQGRRFAPSLEGQQALDVADGPTTPLTKELRPGESYTTRLVFDLPEDSRIPRLLIMTSGGPTRFLIGHENSFLHKRIFFRLEPTTTTDPG